MSFDAPASELTARARRRFALWWLIAALVLGMGLSRLAGAAPAEPAARPVLPDATDSADGLSVVLLEVLTAAWFFVLGSVIGSFLNVVIYRLPLGMSLRHPPSRCPQCETPIAKTDNLPIIGWLKLRGRCRQCRARISARYPLVETATGLIFLVLLIVEVLSGGANLPVRTPNPYAGAAWTVWSGQWDLIGLYLYHCVLMSVLLCLVLMAYDGHAAPRRLFGPALAAGLLLPAVWPALHPVPLVVPRPAWLHSLHWSVDWQPPVLFGRPIELGIGLTGLFDGLAGLAAGAILGRLMGLARNPPVSCARGVAGAGPTAGREAPDERSSAQETGASPSLQPRPPEPLPIQSLESPLSVPPTRGSGGRVSATVAAMAVAGIFLGWQAAVSVAAIAMVLLLPLAAMRRAMGGRGRVPLAAFPVVAALVHILFWRPLSDVFWWPSHRLPLPWMAAVVLGIGLLALAARGLRRRE